MLRRSLLNWVALPLLAMVLITCVLDLGSVHAALQEQSDDAGSLQTLDKDGKPSGHCPLKHTSVKAEISGFLSRVTVTQDFTNPFPDKIEAVYTFPLPQAAAVDDMTMLIGERTVKGKIMRREEARAAYTAAKETGRVASLLDQERPNIFTQAVANIMPGENIRITISYVETLKYEDGAYEWLFPMVVRERYISTAEPKFDSSRVNPTPADGMRAGHDVSLEIQLNAGVPIQSLTSETHETEVERSGDNSAIVRLKDNAAIPNKDFVMKYQVAGNAINDAVLAHRADRGGFFTLVLQPPQRVSAEDVMPKELVFVLDTSGSMNGFPLNKAKETLLLALDNLYPHDTFNLITFAGETRILFPDPVPATPENVRKVKKLLAKVDSSGGTEMMTAIKAALDPSDSQQHVRILCFMTDGAVGADMEIIAEVKKHPNARVFAMGFSDSPNRFLLDKMAEYGRGEVDYVLDQGDTSAVARRFNERVRNPLLTDLSVEWTGLPITDVYPKQIPDLFSAKPVILSGRYANGGKGTIRLKGLRAGQEFVREIPIELPEREPAHDVLATLWARRKIDDLMAPYMAATYAGNQPDQEKEEIAQLGLNFKLMTQFTSFVAVDETIITSGEPPRRVDVPAESTVNSTSGQLSALVLVTASADPSAISSTIVDTRTLQSLPIQGRSFQRLLLLAPGTVLTDTNPATGSLPANISSSGQTPASNLFSVDGVSANFGIAAGGQGAGASAAGMTPVLTATGGTNGAASVSSVNEVAINTAATEPRYGRLPGAQVSLVTRAGSNAFHGSLFYLFGNDALDANDWFANSRSLTKPPRRLNSFGGTFGGPIKEDRTFLFGSYEGLRLRQPVTAITDVPSLNARQSTPASVSPFLNAFPVPNGRFTNEGFAEFAATFANPAREDAGSFRLDHVLNDANHLAFHYNFADSDATTRGAGVFSLNTTNRIRVRSQTITGSLISTLSPTKMFELRGNYGRLRAGGSYLIDGFGGASLPSDFVNVANGSFAFDLNARGSALMSGAEVANVQRQLNLVGESNMMFGKHGFVFGVDYRRLSPILTSRSSEASLLFNGVTQALTGVPTRVNNLTRISPQTPVFHNLSLYVQDDWRKTQRLQLTYGVRWELNPAPEYPDSGTRLWETTYANFAPRFSFAYDLSKQQNADLVLRGGIGVHYSLGQEFAGDAFVDSLPFIDGSSVGNSSLLPTAGGLPFLTFDPDLKLPYVVSWNVMLQRSLGSAQTVSAAYIGSKGRRLLSTQTFFDTDPQFSFLRSVGNRSESDYRSLQLKFDRQLRAGLKVLVSYTWAQSTDNANRDSARRVLLASANPAEDLGASDFDVRHSLTGLIFYQLPAPVAHGFGNRLLRNWAIESFFNARSAKPVNVLYGFPTTYGFAYVRPNVVAGEPLYLLDPTLPGGWRINPNAFSIPSEFTQGDLARNSLRGFPFYQIDLALRRGFNLSEATNLEFRADAFNLLNHPNFQDPLASDLHLGSTFGQSTALAGSGFDSFHSVGGSRTLRFSVKLSF